MNLQIPLWREPTDDEYRQGLVWKDEEDKYYTYIPYLHKLKPIPNRYNKYVEEYLSYRCSLLDPQADIDFPEYLDSTPYDHQITAASFLRYSGGAILADTVGAGKTLSSYLASFQEDGSKVCVVCEASKKRDWAEEAHKHFYLLQRDVQVADGPPSKRYKLYKDQPKVLILNYALLRNDADHLEKILPNYTSIVLDEAHRIKTLTTKTRQAASLVCPPDILRIALTATPYETNVMELFSIAKWSNPSSFPPIGTFLRRYVTFDRFDRAHFKHTKELNWILQPFILRRTWSDIDYALPEIESITLSHDLTPVQKDLYNRYLAMAKSFNDDRALGFYKKMMSTCLHPVAADKEGGSGKVEVLSDLLNKLINQGKNIVCFTESKKFVYWLIDHFSSYDPAYLHGDLSTKQRDEQTSSLGKSTPLMFVTSAGERGINLQQASVVINLDVPSNPARVRQRIGRVARLGQKADVVEAYYLVAKDTIEERLMRKAQTRSVKADEYVNEGKSDSFSDIIASLDPKGIT